MALGIAWFGANGYTVNIPLNDTQWYDFVVEKDGIFKTVQCKATGSANNAISLRSFGGTNGSQYDLVGHHPLDLLFCLDKNGNMYVIPAKEVGQAKQIMLRTEPNGNNQGFQSYKYLVTI